MKLRIIVPFLIVAIALFGAVGLVKSRKPPTPRERAQPPPLVRVMEARAQPVRLDVTSQGEVRPRTETVLVAEVGGRIVEVADALAAGAFFRKGDLLARIDPRDYKVGVAQAEAAVAQADVALAREEGEARIARKDWEALGAAGQPDALVLREPQLAGARAGLASAKATLEKAKLDLARTEIRAPYDGRVRARSVDVGQFVGPGTPLAQVYATDAAEVRLGLPTGRVGDVDLQRAGRGDGAPRVTVRADYGGAEAEWEGRIVRAEGAIDPTTRMLHVIARIDDPFGREDASRAAIPANLYVRANVEGRSLPAAYVVPREALRDDRTLLVVEDGKLRERTVKVERVLGDDAVVTDGLKDGDLVCVSNPRIVSDGMQVRVEKPEEAR